MPEAEKSVFELLAQVPELLLIGGHALQAHGVVRQTLDIDCLVPDGQGTSLEEILRSAGFAQLARTENFSRFRHGRLGHVDILLVDPPTFRQLSHQGRPYEVGGNILHVPSLDHFIALKLHAIKNDPTRELRDLDDIVQLMKVNSISRADLEQLCMRFGSAGIWDKLRVHI